VARQIQIEEFSRGPYETTLGHGELLVAVHVPELVPGSALAHKKISFHERPAVTVAASIAVRDGEIAQAKLALGSVGVTAQRLPDAEACLVGHEVSDLGPGQLDRCPEVAAREAKPVEDANGSVEYKRQLVRVMVERCVREALEEATAV
jgi:carbon-monoxide dehydrogenase medium subunit